MSLSVARRAGGCVSVSAIGVGLVGLAGFLNFVWTLTEHRAHDTRPEGSWCFGFGLLFLGAFCLFLGPFGRGSSWKLLRFEISSWFRL